MPLARSKWKSGMLLQGSMEYSYTLAEEHGWLTISSEHESCNVWNYPVPESNRHC